MLTGLSGLSGLSGLAGGEPASITPVDAVLGSYELGQTCTAVLTWTHTGSGSVAFTARRNVNGTPTVVGIAATALSANTANITLTLVPGRQYGDVTIVSSLNYMGDEETFATETPPLPTDVEHLYAFAPEYTATDAGHATPCTVGQQVYAIKDVITGNWIDRTSGTATLEVDGDGFYYIQPDVSTASRFIIPSAVLGSDCTIALAFDTVNIPASGERWLMTGNNFQTFAVYNTSTSGDWGMCLNSGGDTFAAQGYLGHNDIVITADAGVSAKGYLGATAGADQAYLAFPSTALNMLNTPGVGYWLDPWYGIAIIGSHSDATAVANARQWCHDVNGLS